MNIRKRLGQHFLISQSVAKEIVSSANITKKDVVLEIGAGQGILIPFLYEKAKKVISIESDKKLYQNLNVQFSNIENLVLKCENGFKTKYDFSILVSNLPYSQSKKAIEWLIQKNFSHAVLMVQKEFAKKIQSTGKEKRAISVLVNYALDLEEILNVGKNNFNPTPKVDSIVLRLTSKNVVSDDLIKTVNKLFSYRRKKLQNIAKQFDLSLISDKRLEELSGDEIIDIAKQIINK